MNMKILIIEDEPDLQHEIIAFLEGDGFICESANSYLSADEKLTLYHYDRGHHYSPTNHLRHENRSIMDGGRGGGHTIKGSV